MSDHLRVSDHALRRYLERVMGLDLSDIEAAILQVVEPAYRAGASRVSANGFTYHIKQNTVVTIDGSHSPTISVRRGNQHSKAVGNARPHGGRIGHAKGDRRRPDDESWREKLG